MYNENTLLNEVDTESRQLPSENDPDSEDEEEPCCTGYICCYPTLCTYICCYARPICHKPKRIVDVYAATDEELTRNVCESAAIFKTTPSKWLGCFCGKAGRLQK
jgi:hypothetical protein